MSKSPAVTNDDTLAGATGTGPAGVGVGVGAGIMTLGMVLEVYGSRVTDTPVTLLRAPRRVRSERKAALATVVFRFMAVGLDAALILREKQIFALASRR